jgi:hypothetical protein
VIAFVAAAVFELKSLEASCVANTIGCREFEIIIVVASRSASTASWRRSGRATAGALNSLKDHLITSISLMNDFATPLPFELSVSIATLTH